eukprot:18816-Heterococcus_DN1.PRE.3
MSSSSAAVIAAEMPSSQLRSASLSNSNSDSICIHCQAKQQQQQQPNSNSSKQQYRSRTARSSSLPCNSNSATAIRGSSGVCTFKPQTNSVPDRMLKAKEYLRLSVCDRLYRPFDAATTTPFTLGIPYTDTPAVAVAAAVFSDADNDDSNNNNLMDSDNTEHVLADDCDQSVVVGMDIQSYCNAQISNYCNAPADETTDNTAGNIAVYDRQQLHDVTGINDGGVGSAGEYAAATDQQQQQQQQYYAQTPSDNRTATSAASGTSASSTPNRQQQHTHRVSQHHLSPTAASIGHFMSSNDALPQQQQQQRRRNSNHQTFQQFLSSQNHHHTKKQMNIAKLTAAVMPSFTPHIDEHSRQIASEKLGKSVFLQRVEIDAMRHQRGLRRAEREHDDKITAACTFKPTVNESSKHRRARTAVELSVGDVIKRDRKRQAARVRQETVHAQQHTFKPVLHTEGTGIAPLVSEGRLMLQSDPDSYLARVEQARHEREAALKRQYYENMIANVAQCTFTPEIRACPAFIQRTAEGYALLQQQQQQQQQKQRGRQQERQLPEWRHQ